MPSAGGPAFIVFQPFKRLLAVSQVFDQFIRYSPVRSRTNPKQRTLSTASVSEVVLCQRQVEMS